MAEKIVDMKKVFAELSRSTLSADQVFHILNNPKEFPLKLIEQLSIDIALKYWQGELSYESADCIANNIYVFWISNDYFSSAYPFTDAAWECYEAFDSGEYRRINDDENVIPHIKYTRPLIEEFLRKRMLIP